MNPTHININHFYANLLGKCSPYRARKHPAWLRIQKQCFVIILNFGKLITTNAADICTIKEESWNPILRKMTNETLFTYLLFFLFSISMKHEGFLFFFGDGGFSSWSSLTFLLNFNNHFCFLIISKEILEKFSTMDLLPTEPELSNTRLNYLIINEAFYSTIMLWV